MIKIEHTVCAAICFPGCSARGKRFAITETSILDHGSNGGRPDRPPWPLTTSPIETMMRAIHARPCAIPAGCCRWRCFGLHLISGGFLTAAAMLNHLTLLLSPGHLGSVVLPYTGAGRRCRTLCLVGACRSRRPDPGSPCAVIND